MVIGHKIIRTTCLLCETETKNEKHLNVINWLTLYVSQTMSTLDVDSLSWFVYQQNYGYTLAF